VGKDLVCILYLAGLGKRQPSADKGAARTWFGFVDKNKKQHPVLKRIDMSSWATYRGG
jgi:hypothetical protein